MEPATHTLLWVVTGIGYVFFILPGLALTVFLLFARFISGQVIKNRFPAMVANIERIAQNRAGLKTPPLS